MSSELACQQLTAAPERSAELEFFRSRPVWAEVDLDAIDHNLDILRRAARSARVIAVVKANAYGHGAVAVARAALEAGAAGVAVACVDEGEELRRAGIRGQVMILGYTPIADAGRVVALSLEPTVSCYELLSVLSRFACKYELPVRVHIELDTGFNRHGVSVAEVVPLAEQARVLPGVQVQSLFTHFATAEEADQTFVDDQFELLVRASEQLPWIPERHCAASASLVLQRDFALEAARLGLGLYGYNPAPACAPQVRLRPAMALRSLIARVWQVPAGASAGYGRSWRAKQATRLALLTCGYADGYRRCFSNRSHVLIRGGRARLVGRVSMDMCVVDVTHIPDLACGEVATLLGRDGDDAVGADELAELADTIPWDILAGIAARVPRVYMRSGFPVERAALNPRNSNWIRKSEAAESKRSSR